MQLRHLLPLLALLPALAAPLHSHAAALHTVHFLAPGFAPTGINNTGQMSGFLIDANNQNQAALSSGGIVTNLGIFGGGSNATGVNNAGRIAAWGCRDAICGAVRLDMSHSVPEPEPEPEPEPSVAPMMLFGLLTFISLRAQYRTVTGPRHFACPSLTLEEKMLKPKCLFILALLPAILAPVHTQAEPLYNVGLFVDNFTAWDMNNSGQMAGAAGTNSEIGHAARYANGVVSDLGAGGAFGRAQAINDAGDITGTVDYDGGYIGDFHGFVYRNGVLTNLGARSIGAGINASGDVVGSVSTSASVDRTAALYSGGQWTQLGNIADGDDGGAVDINDLGQIVGFAKVTDLHYSYDPFLYTDGTLYDLGSVTGFSVNGASAINNAGRIAGYGEGWDGRHAFVYENGLTTDLGTFGGLELDVGGINESGTFVGSASREDETRLGFIYLDGALVDLNTLIDPALGWRIDSAAAINDSGQIAAHACRGYACGTLRLDLASAVPEPGGAVLIVPGLLLLARRQRMRLQQHHDAPAAS